MAKYSNQDDYLDSKTGILKNKLGIEDETELEEVEADYAMVRYYELTQKPLKGNFDLKHLKALHHHLFGDVYDWAGQLRTIYIPEGNSYFADLNCIETAAKAIFAELAKENFLHSLNS
jgi:cell filamentation protein